jgi:hypothetical protein
MSDLEAPPAADPQFTEDVVSHETNPVQQVEAPAGVEGVPTDGTDATSGSEGQARDENGRFVATSPAEEAPPRFAPALMNVATQFLTEDEIASIPSATMLLDVVRGRAAQIPQQPQTAPQAPAGQPEPATGIEDFNLQLPEGEDELSPEIAEQLKGLTGYVNKLKAGMEELRTQNAELTQGVQQSAKTQSANFWDDVAASVPGMIDAIGKPSAALVNNGTAQANQWSQLAPLIAARAQAQNVPQGMMDFNRAAKEAWSMYQTLNANTNPTGPNGRPGEAIRGAPRMSVSPRTAPKANMSVAEDYDYRLAKLEQAFAANGGQNPFS